MRLLGVAIAFLACRHAQSVPPRPASEAPGQRSTSEPDASGRSLDASLAADPEWLVVNPGRGYTFRAPPSIRNLEAQGIDSYVQEVAVGTLEILFEEPMGYWSLHRACEPDRMYVGSLRLEPGDQFDMGAGAERVWHTAPIGDAGSPTCHEIHVSMHATGRGIHDEGVARRILESLAFTGRGERE
ncbi:MAG: hypothetical protein WCJ30_07725 [Deltaproteobacteria bacterium]